MKGGREENFKEAMVNTVTCSRDVHWDEDFKISH